MSDKDPEYTESGWSYQKRIATRCRNCGKQLTHPNEMKKEYCFNCNENYKSKTYTMR
jgi:uncharacterized OB-fold protein